MKYKFEFETQGAATFLVYKKEESDVIDTMTMGMLSNNTIEGILPFIYGQVNADTFFKYNVSSQCTLNQYLSGGISRKRFLTVLNNLLDNLILTEEYMLEMSSVVLKPEYIFVNANELKTSVVVLPLVIEEENAVEDFVKNLLFSTKFDQNEDCSYIAALISFLNSGQFFSIHKLKEKVEDLLNSQVIKASAARAVTQTKPERRQPSVNMPVQAFKMENTVDEVTNIPGVMGCQGSMQGAPQPVKEEKSVEMSESVPPKMHQAVKEKKSLFGRKEKKESVVTKGMPAPPPFEGVAMPQMQAKAEPEKLSKPQKVKKSFLGSKEKEGKKVKQNKIAIPGVESSVASVESDAGKKAQHTGFTGDMKKSAKEQPATSVSQTMIPTQQVEMEKHSVQVQNFGETTLLNAGKYGETTVLTAGTAPVMPRKPYLIRVKNNEQIPVNKGEFNIGRDGSRVDYCVKGNSAVSGCHASIIIQGNQYAIEDTNSTNYTYVNGQMILSNQKVPIMDGDMIRLANEEFIFQLI